MNRSILISAHVILLFTLLLPSVGRSTEIVGYITMQNSSNEAYNGILGIRLFAQDPDDRYGDIMVLEHPDIPWYIANFPDFTYLVTANWRNSTGHEDTWAKVEPQIVQPPQWDVYDLSEMDRSNPSGVAVTEIDDDIYVVVSHTLQDSIGFYDDTGHPISPNVVEVGNYPMGIDITEDPDNPGDYYALVACRDEDSVAVVSFSGGLVDKWYAGNEPVDLRAVIVDDEWKCYVVNKSIPFQSVGKVTVLKWGGSIETSFNVGVRPVAIDNAPAGSPFEDRIYVVNNGSENVYCVDMDNGNAIIDTLELGVGSPTAASPVDVALAPSAQDNEYRGIIINTANKSYYVFTMNTSRPYHRKDYEETNQQISGASSIHSVTVIEE